MKQITLTKRMFVLLAALALAVVGNFASSSGVVHADTYNPYCWYYTDVTYTSYHFCPNYDQQPGDIINQLTNDPFNSGTWSYWDSQGNEIQGGTYFFSYGGVINVTRQDPYDFYTITSYTMYPIPGGNGKFWIYKSMDELHQVPVNSLLQ